MVAIQDYIAEDSPQHARRFMQRLFNAAELLIEQPWLGRRVPEAAHPDVRELIVQGYRLFIALNPCGWIFSLSSMASEI